MGSISSAGGVSSGLSGMSLGGTITTASAGTASTSGAGEEVIQVEGTVQQCVAALRGVATLLRGWQIRRLMTVMKQQQQSYSAMQMQQAMAGMSVPMSPSSVSHLSMGPMSPPSPGVPLAVLCCAAAVGAAKATGWACILLLHAKPSLLGLYGHSPNPAHPPALSLTPSAQAGIMLSSTLISPVNASFLAPSGHPGAMHLPPPQRPNCSYIYHLSNAQVRAVVCVFGRGRVGQQLQVRSVGPLCAMDAALPCPAATHAYSGTHPAAGGCGARQGWRPHRPDSADEQRTRDAAGGERL